MQQQIDIINLAKAAHARGMDTPDRVAAHLERLIAKNAAYLERRRRNGQSTSFDIQAGADNEALAVAIIYLEGMEMEKVRHAVERVVRYTALQIASGSGSIDGIITDILGENEEHE